MELRFRSPIRLHVKHRDKFAFRQTYLSWIWYEVWGPSAVMMTTTTGIVWYLTLRRWKGNHSIKNGLHGLITLEEKCDSFLRTVGNDLHRVRASHPTKVVSLWPHLLSRSQVHDTWLSAVLGNNIPALPVHFEAPTLFQAHIATPYAT